MIAIGRRKFGATVLGVILTAALHSLPVLSGVSETKGLPTRIASATLGSDEILTDLLARCERQSHLIALSTVADDATYSNITKEAKRIPGRAGNDIEGLLRLKPDLVVVAAYNRPEFLRRIKEAKVQVLELKSFASLSDISENIRQLAKAVGCEAPGKQMIADFEKGVSNAANTIAGTSSSFTIAGYGAGGLILGKETTFDSMLQALKITNAASKLGVSGWAKIDPEVLAGLNPSLIVASGKAEDAPKILEQLRAQPGWKLMPAIKEGRILLIPEAELSAVSPHVLKAVEKIAAEVKK
jgi:iron complex transport system substrate-binding protein